MSRVVSRGGSVSRDFPPVASLIIRYISSLEFSPILIAATISWSRSIEASASAIC